MDSAKAIRGHGLVCLRENLQILVGKPDEREWASERPAFPFPTRTKARRVAAECQLQKVSPSRPLLTVYLYRAPRILEANEVRYKSQTELGRRFARAARHQARKGRRRRAHRDDSLQSKVISRRRPRASRIVRTVFQGQGTSGTAQPINHVWIHQRYIAKQVFAHRNKKKKFLRPASKTKTKLQPCNGFADKKAAFGKRFALRGSKKTYSYYIACWHRPYIRVPGDAVCSWRCCCCCGHGSGWAAVVRYPRLTADIARRSGHKRGNSRFEEEHKRGRGRFPRKAKLADRCGKGDSRNARSSRLSYDRRGAVTTFHGPEIRGEIDVLFRG